MSNLYSGTPGAAGTVAVLQNGQTSNTPNAPDHFPPIRTYSNTELIRRIVAYARPHGLLGFVAFVASFVSTVLQLYLPILVGRGIDCIVGIGQVDFGALFAIVSRMLFVVLCAVPCNWLASSSTQKLAARIARDLRRDLSEHVHHVPIAYHDTQLRGDTLSRCITDVEAVADGLIQGFGQFFSGIVSVCATVAFMLSLSVSISLLVIVLTPLSIAVAAGIAHLSASSFDAQQGLFGKLSACAEESVSEHQLIRSFAQEHQFKTDFDSYNQSLRQVGEHAQFMSSLSNPTTRLVNNIIYALVACVGCISIAGLWPLSLSVGTLLSFLSYANQYMRPFNEVSAVLTQLETARAGAARIFAFLDEACETDCGTLRCESPVSGRIEMDDVHFSYRAGCEVLKGISLCVHPGQRVALVGPTGSGKTTLINLLMRFYEPDSGSLLLDNQDISTFTKDSLRSAFGMVLQHGCLFEGSIYENIAYAKPNATREEVIEAARSAQVHAFIEQLPYAYETHIESDGSPLSQGQRQLICIARVILANPSVLILDEATSFIDARTERQVQKACELLMQGRTTLVVAHRLSTIKDADCILVMKDGRICEQGSYQELLERNAEFVLLSAQNNSG